jgi:O-methyltransferase involved in polyketide biosynthesis
MEPYDFRRVSVTALVTAFGRAEYTTIPWAKEIFAVMRQRGANLPDGPWLNEGRDFAPFLDARFQAVNRLLDEKGATQVLELAAGLSPRGMELAPRGVVYVEVDLAESITMKREVVAAVLGSVPPSLHLSAASVVDRAQLLECCTPFDIRQPVAVTTEGLLRYLTFEEKTNLAETVHQILRRYGGWWITPDIHLKVWARRQTAAYLQTELELLGRSLDSHYFADLDHAQTFFEGCGFAVDSRPLLEGIRDQIVPAQREDQITELNERRIFVLTPQH